MEGIMFGMVLLVVLLGGVILWIDKKDNDNRKR